MAELGEDDRSSGRLGTTLRGKYRLDRVLGVGGMAVVYAATHRNLKRFAVKMLHAELSIRDDIRTRFLREGYAANSLDHPGAVAVLDDDVAEDGSAFLVMELLHGGGVDQLWEKSGRRMSPRVVLALGYQLLDVLAVAHAKGIVHRDIKPPNIFLTEEGALKVLDFGIARVRDAVVSGMQTTGTGMLLGTPAFMAPEQAHAKSSEIDGQSDVWAAGATLFTLLSGQLVHEGENATQLLIKAATTQARSLAIVAPGAPPELVEIVDRALAFEKAARWPNAKAMRDAIRDGYQKLFSEALSRAPLLALFPSRDEPLPPTEHAPEPAAVAAVDPKTPSLPEVPWPRPSADLSAGPAGAPRLVLSAESMVDSTRSSPAAGTLPAGATPVGASIPGPILGMTTSKPVSSEAPQTPHGVPSRKRTSPAVLGVVAVGAVAVIFATFEIGARSRAGAGAPPPTDPLSVAASGPPATPPSPAAATTPVTAMAPSTVSSSASATPAPSAPSPTPEVLARPQPGSKPNASHRREVPVTAAMSAPPASSVPSKSAPPAALPAPSPAATPVCSAVPYYDEFGGKHFKQECR
jgi:serine/threonine protein kinase